MATAKTPQPGRVLAIVALVVAALYAGVLFGDTHTPQLGLDLRGGTSVTLTPRAASGNGKVTKSSISKAVDIIRQRVNGLGVGDAAVSTEGSNIIVSVPGKGRSDVIKLVGTTAQLRFRQVLQSVPPGPTTPQPSASPTKSTKGSPAPKRSASAKPSAARKPTPSPTGNGRVAPRALLATPSPTPSASAPTAPNPTSSGAATPNQTAEQRLATLDCTDPKNRQGGGLDTPDQQVVACERDGSAKYLLAKAEVLGTEVTGATATLDSQTGQGWLVQLNFNGSGQRKFGALTQRVQPLPMPTNQVAVVLDGVVQSAPSIREPILDGRAEISGNFTEKEARDLANVLKYGALPLAFDIPTAETISPTLGSDQLRAGLLAGAIGLVLVILYSLLYYRALGFITIASLALSGLIIYAATTLLGHLIDYTLTLAGIAGYIVAVGITADSFVVYFERLRDEVREGRTLRSGIERAWVRARRTILSADTVSLLAAVVLYLVSIGGVRGFAFTLGLSTLVDLFVVFFFTKPLITLLARTNFFGGAGPLSGLSSARRASVSSTAQEV